MKITNPITLDVARSNSYICLLGKQFDSNSRYLQVTLTNNGQPLPIPSGAGVVLRATRADGAGSMTAGSVNGDGTALVEIDETVLEVAGAASLSIEVTSGGQVLTSASCNLTVQKADASGWVKVYVAAASVSAGTYHISLAGQSYSFTTTQTIPAGGAIYFNSDGGTAQTRDASGNVLDAALTLTAGTSGTELTSDVPTMTFLAALAQQVGQLADTDNAVAGSAEALLGGGTAENVAVALRGNAGNAREKIGKLVGGTIAWNQLIQKSMINLSGSNSGVTFTSNSTTGEVTTSGTASGYPYRKVGSISGLVTGHKFFQGFSAVNPTGGNLEFRVITSNRAEYYSGVGVFSAGSASYDIEATGTTNSGSYANGKLSNYMLTDLTTALGPTIADYVYTLESGTAGAGVAWLARYFPKILGGYYAYAAPALLSVNVEGKKISGFNLFDYDAVTVSSPIIKANNGFSGTISQLATPITNALNNSITWMGNVQYCIRADVVTAGTNVKFQVNYTDGTSSNSNSTSGTATIQAISTAGKTVSSVWLTYGGGGSGATTISNICISLSNPLLNGQYFPHREFYYPIQSGELRGVPKLDANNNLTFDGDWQEPDGTRTRRYGAIDLGTLNWIYVTSAAGTKLFLSPAIADIKVPANNDTAPHLVIAKPYAVEAWNSLNIGANAPDAIGVFTDQSVRIVSSAYNDPAVFKTAMSGVYLIYELATPYTEAGQPFLAVERLDNGIEEVVDAGVEAGTRDVVVPVGQDATIYRDLAALLGAIPNPPTSAGTYTLHATVTTTNATFSWI